jgi:hypothetical protein
VRTIKSLSCLIAIILAACGTAEQNAWTFGIARDDAMEISRLIHAQDPSCKIYRFIPHPERGEIDIYTDCKPFIAHKVRGRWELKKGEIIVVT